MFGDPVVSVVMAARDAASTIEEAIESVQAQTFAEWELLVIDDGSTDGTPEIVERLSRRDARIRLLYGASRGVAATRNVGLGVARGRRIAILDADDLCLPERLERQVAFLDSHPGLAAVASRPILFVEQGRPMGLSAVARPASLEELEVLKTAGELIVLCHSSVMWDAVRLHTLGGYDERFDQAEDAEAINRAVYQCGWPVLVLPTPLVCYRVTEGGLSTQGLTRQRVVLRYLEGRNGAWRRGEDPVGFEDFMTRHRSLRTRWRWWRHDFAAASYRRAGLKAALGSPVWAATHLLTALSLHPRYVLIKLWKQRVRGDARRAVGSMAGDSS
jgi:glycosyltransferase involved in cell wall biosynthesis